MVPLGERFLASAYGSGGYYYGITPGAGNGGNLYVAGGLGLAYAVQPFLSLGAEGRYRYLADGRSGSLLNGVSITMSARLTFLSPRKLKIQDLQLKPVFPVLYKYYATRPIGTLKLSNEGAVPLEDIKVTLSVERYMDGPTSCVGPKVLAPRSDGAVQLFALFNQSVLEITEGNVVSARVAVEYTVDGKPYTTEVTQPLRLYDRNAITWDDDRKAAVYVTAKDPLVLEIAKPIARWSREQPTAFDGNFLLAMAIHESLRLHGVNYVVDPTSPYSDRTKTTLAVDYLQFPRFTLAYKAGDCDDLSILYAALLQSVGVDTAFITIPNHIYLAVALKMPFEEAQRTFLDKEDVIDFDGRAWIPLEVTMVQRRFLEAWSTGAREWRDNAARNAAKLLPMYRSWAEYEPVASVSGQGQVGFPPPQDLKDAYMKELQRFTRREIQPREDDLLKQAAQGKESWKPLNALGILYARYGQVEKAQARFEEVLRKIQYGPALLNLGNIYFMKNQTDKALEYLAESRKGHAGKAVRAAPDCALLLRDGAVSGFTPLLCPVESHGSESREVFRLPRHRRRRIGQGFGSRRGEGSDDMAGRMTLRVAPRCAAAVVLWMALLSTGCSDMLTTALQNKIEHEERSVPVPGSAGALTIQDVRAGAMVLQWQTGRRR